MNILQKLRGGGQKPIKANVWEIFLSWLGSLLGIGLIVLLDVLCIHSGFTPLLIAPFGASAVLIFGLIRSPLAQPRNLVAGHIVSAFVGVTCAHLPTPLCFNAALSVATAIAFMHATGTLHPPGGATALTAVIGGENIRELGYMYVLMPCALGACILLFVALLFNNLAKNRQYPLYWW